MYVATADITVGNTTDETTMIGSGVGLLTIPAGSLAIGDIIEVHIEGHYSTKSAPVGNLTIRPKIGGTAVSANADAPNEGETDMHFDIVFNFVVRTLGATGTCFGSGHGIYQYTVGGEVTQFWPLDGASTTEIDTTSDLAIDFTAQWETQDASNTLTVTQCIIKKFN